MYRLIRRRDFSVIILFVGVKQSANTDIYARCLALGDLGNVQIAALAHFAPVSDRGLPRQRPFPAPSRAEKICINLAFGLSLQKHSVLW